SMGSISSGEARRACSPSRDRPTSTPHHQAAGLARGISPYSPLASHIVHQREEIMTRPVEGNRAGDPARPSRRKLLVGAAAGAAILGAPAMVRSQQPRRFLRPLVAGLNAKEGDPSYESIARIPKILREKYNVLLEIQMHPSSVLGTDVQQLESVQTGFIDITSNVTAQWSSFSDAFTFVDLPYAITNWDMFLRLAKSDLWR